MPATRTHHLLLAAIVVAALVARAAAFSTFGIHHPDESIQYLEQAHRLAFGSGLVPWEYRLGMRSWLIPLALAGPMWLGDQLAPGTTLYLILPRILCAAVALAPIWAAFRIGWRISAAHGLVAAAIVGLWFESVYFSVHVLTETLAVALFLPAAALLLGPRNRARLAGAGALLALAVIVRFHYGPAIAVFVALTLRTRWRDWGWLIAGALGPALLSSLIDLMMGQWPFAWVVANVTQNVVHGQAARFGELGPLAYAQMLGQAWGIAAIPILWLAGRAAWRFPALAATAVVNLLVHLAIGHKEYRFILLSTQLAILLAAIGTVDLVTLLRRRLRQRSRRRAPGRRVLFCAATAIWGATSLWLASSPGDFPDWRKFADDHRLMRLAAAQKACGVAVAWRRSWMPIGQVWLHDATPIYYLPTPDPGRTAPEAYRVRPAANAIIAVAGSPSVLPGYRRVACGRGPDRLCLSMRPGPCTRTPATEPLLMQQVMIRNGR